MSTLAATAPHLAPPTTTWPLGRMFVHPVFDFLLIGGGLSLAAGALAWAGGLAFTQGHIPAILLLGNFAHFAASTVRLYVTSDATRRWPFLTIGFPLVCLLVGTGVLMFADWLVRYVFAVFLVWSPYHYAAQAYGLAAMYAYRSDCPLDDTEKRWLRAACLLPFLFALLRPQGGIGVTLRHLGVTGGPALESTRVGVSVVISALALAAPIVAFVVSRRRRGRTLPLISVMLVAVNAIWWTGFNYINAFFWAALFHGVQYLAIAAVFHVREQTRRPENRRGWIFHTVLFYGACVALAYVLFVLWPETYVVFGYDRMLTAQLVVAVINIHHFAVDAYIWRLRRDPNYRTVVGASAPSAVSAG